MYSAHLWSFFGLEFLRTGHHPMAGEFVVIKSKQKANARKEETSKINVFFLPKPFIAQYSSYCLRIEVGAVGWPRLLILIWTPWRRGFICFSRLVSMWKEEWITRSLSRQPGNNKEYTIPKISCRVPPFRLYILLLFCIPIIPSSSTTPKTTPHWQGCST